jgi:hypothetical protein
MTPDNCGLDLHRPGGSGKKDDNGKWLKIAQE